MMKKIISYILMLTWAGYTYVCIELIVRHQSDITMMFCASICAIPMVLLNDYFSYDFDFILQALFSALFCTLAELVFGLIFNQDHNIWDYSNMIFNYKGQICLPFFFVWILISIPIIIIADWMEYYIFDLLSEPPYYKIFGKEVYHMKQKERR